MDNPIYIKLLQFNKVMDSLSGRDKVTKALQYGAKIISYSINLKKDSIISNLNELNISNLLENELLDLDKQKVFYNRILKRVSNFESSISDARKVFRFFKSIGSLLDVYKFIINLYNFYLKKYLFKKNENLKNNSEIIEFKLKWIDFVRIIQKFLLSIYILYDHASWAAKVQLFSDVNELNASHLWQKLFNNSRAKNYSETSCKMWFIGTLLTLISDIYDYFDIFNQEISILREKSKNVSQLNEGFLNLNDFIDMKTNAEMAIPSNDNITINGSINNTKMSQLDERLKKVQDKKIQITRNLMKNTADLMVAGNGGYKVWSLNNGIIGLCGCISSFIGLYESWPSNVK